MAMYFMEMDPPNFRSDEDIVSGDLKALSFDEALVEAYHEVRRFAMSRMQKPHDKIVYRIYSNIHNHNKLIVNMEFESYPMIALPEPEKEQIHSISSRIKILKNWIEETADRDKFWKGSIGDLQFASAQASLPQCQLQLAALEAELMSIVKVPNPPQELAQKP